LGTTTQTTLPTYVGIASSAASGGSSSSNGGGGLSGGAIAGIVIGAVAALVVIAVLVLLVFRYRRKAIRAAVEHPAKEKAGPARQASHSERHEGIAPPAPDARSEPDMQSAPEVHPAPEARPAPDQHSEQQEALDPDEIPNGPSNQLVVWQGSQITR
jgi:uncharacterized membrane protein